MTGLVARAGLALIKPAPRSPALDGMAMLDALPVATLLLDAANGFRYANHAAEQFLGLSMLQLAQIRLSALLPEDNPIFDLLVQVRSHGATIVDHDLALESPRLHKRGITVQGTPLGEEPGAVLVTLTDSSAARALHSPLSRKLPPAAR